GRRTANGIAGTKAAFYQSQKNLACMMLMLLCRAEAREKFGRQRCGERARLAGKLRQEHRAGLTFFLHWRAEPIHARQQLADIEAADVALRKPQELHAGMVL